MNAIAAKAVARPRKLVDMSESETVARATPIHKTATAAASFLVGSFLETTASKTKTAGVMQILDSW